MAGGKFGEPSAIRQTKPSKLVVTINNLLLDLFICQTFFAKIFIHPLSPNIIAAKISHYTVASYYVHSYTVHTAPEGNAIDDTTSSKMSGR